MTERQRDQGQSPPFPLSPSRHFHLRAFFFGKAEKEHFGGKERETIDILLNADLLILDDIGAEFESKFYNSLFYNILNNRMNAAKPTIISTNCELNELLQRYGDRIVSRLKTMDDLIFLGTDVRILRASEHNS